VGAGGTWVHRRHAREGDIITRNGSLHSFARNHEEKKSDEKIQEANKQGEAKARNNNYEEGRGRVADLTITTCR
jgi:hypothetical protein